MVRETCGKCNDKYWITAVLNLAPSSVSPAEERRRKQGKRVGRNRGRR